MGHAPDGGAACSVDRNDGLCCIIYLIRHHVMANLNYAEAAWV
jgi:hypothetical protein